MAKNKYSGKRIAVTGAAGFIGSWLCNELVSNGYFTVGIDDLSGGCTDNLLSIRKNKLFEFYQCDLRDKDHADFIFHSFRPQIVYHLAANARESASFFQPISVVSRNTLSFINTVTAAIKYGLERIIFTSSIAAYGDQSPPFSEDMDLRPVDIYGLQKANIEKMIDMLSIAHGFEYVVLRPHNCFGSFQAFDIYRNFIAIVMNKIMRGEPIVIYGNGEQERAFSYIENDLPCYLRAMNARSRSVYNIGSDQPRRIIDATKVIIKAMGKKEHPIEYLNRRHHEVFRAHADHTRAKQELGLKEFYSFEEGVHRMSKWARGLGPQEWRSGDKLELMNKKVPENWR